MQRRYGIRLKSRSLNKVKYGVMEIVRLADGTKVHEVWAKPIGGGPTEAEQIRKLLEEAPDDQAEEVIKEFEMKQQAKMIEGLSWALRDGPPKQ